MPASQASDRPPAEDWTYRDYSLPEGWSAERKWLRIRELLTSATSVEVIPKPGGYTLRAWFPRPSR